VMVLLSGCTLGLQPLPDSIQEQIEYGVDHGMDGIIVCVNRPGETQLYSAGWKNREEQIPADPHALFKIASISKLYIAAATTLLIADEKLSPEQTLAELIPEVQGKIEYANQITLKMMIRHRSGIPEYIYKPDFKSDTANYLATASLIFGDPADFKPDAKYSYSNTNYLLIGEILDRTLGYSHHEFIKNEILIPLGLSNTYSLYSEVDPDDVMSGYLKGYEHDLKSWDHTQPGGSMIATAEDVATFLRALIDGTLFNKEEQALYSSLYEYEHTGWLPGYTSIVRYHSDINAVVVQFVSTSGKEIYWLELKRIYKRIVRIIEKNPGS